MIDGNKLENKLKKKTEKSKRMLKQHINCL